MTLEMLATEDGKRNPDEHISEAALILEQAIREVRTVSYLFYPPMLEEMGLRTAVESYLEGFRQRSGLQVSFEAGKDFSRLPRDTELALFRVLQESLTNVLRHSESATAQVRLKMENEWAILEVQDQGKGAPAEALRFGSDSTRTFGVGLRGMNERLVHSGGKLEVISSEKGTTVRATVPLRGSEDLESSAAASGG